MKYMTGLLALAVLPAAVHLLSEPAWAAVSPSQSAAAVQVTKDFSMAFRAALPMTREKVPSRANDPRWLTDFWSSWMVEARGFDFTHSASVIRDEDFEELYATAFSEMIAAEAQVALTSEERLLEREPITAMTNQPASVGYLPALIAMYISAQSTGNRLQTQMAMIGWKSLSQTRDLRAAQQSGLYRPQGTNAKRNVMISRLVYQSVQGPANTTQSPMPSLTSGVPVSAVTGYLWKNPKFLDHLNVDTIHEPNKGEVTGGMLSVTVTFGDEE